MNEQDKNVVAWNSIADRYESKFMDLRLYDDTYDRFIVNLNKQRASLLEIGCGPGMISRYLLDKNSNYVITAVDAATNMVARAQVNLPRATVKLMDCREILSLKAKFDGIVCGFVIPYLTIVECARLFEDCGNMLEDHGLFYLSFVPGNSDAPLVLGESMSEKMYFYEHSSDKILELLNKNSFSVLESFEKIYERKDGGEIHQILLLQKNNYRIHVTKDS